jgi:hypothetical protein
MAGVLHGDLAGHHVHDPPGPGGPGHAMHAVEPGGPGHDGTGHLLDHAAQAVSGGHVGVVQEAHVGEVGDGIVVAQANPSGGRPRVAGKRPLSLGPLARGQQGLQRLGLGRQTTQGGTVGGQALGHGLDAVQAAADLAQPLQGIAGQGLAQNAKVIEEGLVQIVEGQVIGGQAGQPVLGGCARGLGKGERHWFLHFRWRNDDHSASLNQCLFVIENDME